MSSQSEAFLAQSKTLKLWEACVGVTIGKGGESNGKENF